MTSKQEKLFLQQTAEAVETACLYYLDGCAGYCTFVCGLLAYALDLRGFQVTTVAGKYAGKYHWWLEVDQRWRLDPTRSQFDRGQLLEEINTASQYQQLMQYPDDWTGHQAAEAFVAFFAARTDEVALSVWKTIFPDADQEFISELLTRWRPDVALFNEIMTASLACDHGDGIDAVEEKLTDRLNEIKDEQKLLRSAQVALVS